MALKRRNWRVAYSEMARSHEQELRRQRELGSTARVYVGHKTFITRDIEDVDLLMIARIEAERDVNRAIQLYNESVEVDEDDS